MKFCDHKYTWQRPFYQVRHQWSFRGPQGGVSFHICQWEGEGAAEKTQKFGGPSAGLEFHHNFDPTGGKEAAHHARCWLLEGPCWHNGTSLHATETLLPIIRYMMPDHSAIFHVLESEYESHFEGGIL